ncbi:hypothetical protein CEXT_769241 [Caerostris extrusa]|uniref:Uncharacterized protein n=1 Tax=Caerostris extrusa TaxID=172846 RepID=A0AAV4RWC6_CAEEX|nr:hypothetical protein CEXT_769241 [Caerostris extrusa]
MRFCGACKPYKGSNNKEGALQPLFAPMAIVPEGKTKRGPKNLSPRPYRMDYISLTPSGSSGAAKRFGGWGRECNSTPPSLGGISADDLFARADDLRRFLWPIPFLLFIFFFSLYSPVEKSGICLP